MAAYGEKKIETGILEICAFRIAFGGGKMDRLDNSG